MMESKETSRIFFFFTPDITTAGLFPTHITTLITTAGVLRENLESKFDRMMAFKKTSEERTSRVAVKMTTVSKAE